MVQQHRVVDLYLKRVPSISMTVSRAQTIRGSDPDHLFIIDDWTYPPGVAVWRDGKLLRSEECGISSVG